MKDGSLMKNFGSDLGETSNSLPVERFRAFSFFFSIRKKVLSYYEGMIDKRFSNLRRIII